jgi:hypothetical protein
MGLRRRSFLNISAVSKRCQQALAEIPRPATGKVRSPVTGAGGDAVARERQRLADRGTHLFATPRGSTGGPG